MPSKKPDLDSKARDFARTLTDALNGTITTGIRLSAITTPGLNNLVFVGYKVSKSSPTSREPMPVGKDRRLYLSVFYELHLDDRDFLAVRTSVISVFLDQERKHELLHFDYERDKADGYPEAHVQVIATSDDWDTLLAGKPEANDSLRKLHIPVGGRRFRPALEHIIEFLICEHLVEPVCDDWQDTLDASRREFEGRQLRAAIWRHPEVAQEALNAYRAAQAAEEAAQPGRRTGITRGKATRHRGRDK